jgi:hypothetical protein
MIQYTPRPIDTNHILLPTELHPLIEKLAENNHEEWSHRRMKDGWVYGAQRCDEKKHHPCLIPYEELPESEKEYDRISALATVKLLLVLGYKITS